MSKQKITVSWRIIGYSYFGITSSLPVTRPESSRNARIHDQTSEFKREFTGPLCAHFLKGTIDFREGLSRCRHAQHPSPRVEDMARLDRVATPAIHPTRNFTRSLHADLSEGLLSGDRPRSAIVQVFGCRQTQDHPRAREAGVRKAPRHEVAGSGAPGECRAMGIWRQRECWRR
jgi:hypothetical protein